MLLMGERGDPFSLDPALWRLGRLQGHVWSKMEDAHLAAVKNRNRMRQSLGEGNYPGLVYPCDLVHTLVDRWKG